MTKKELIEGLNKYSDNTEIYVYDIWGSLSTLNYIEEGMTCHGRGYKGKENKIIFLKNKD